jgi:hypothetical protein
MLLLQRDDFNISNASLQLKPMDGDNIIPPTDTIENFIPTPLPSSKQTEQQAESILKLLLANLDKGDVRTIAQILLPEYTKYCINTLDCEELHSALRRLYLARYSELQLALHRMDKLGLLLRRIQYLTEQSALDTGLIPHRSHHRRSRDYPPALKRVERNRGDQHRRKEA